MGGGGGVVSSLDEKDPAISANSVRPTVGQSVPSERCRHDLSDSACFHLLTLRRLSQGARIRPTARAACFLKWKSERIPHSSHYDGSDLFVLLETASWAPRMTVLESSSLVDDLSQMDNKWMWLQGGGSRQAPSCNFSQGHQDKVLGHRSIKRKKERKKSIM